MDLILMMLLERLAIYGLFLKKKIRTEISFLL